MLKKGTKRKTGTVVPIRITRTRRGALSSSFGLWIPGFGNPGCEVLARDARAARKAVAEFVGNELMNAKTLMTS